MSIRPVLCPILLLALLIACAGLSPPPSRALAEQDLGLEPRSELDTSDTARVFHFAVIGDRTGGERPGVFGRALEMLNLLQPAFVVSIGDLIEGYTSDTSILRTQWEELDSMVGTLLMPFFRVAGNHDILTPESACVWNDRYGCPYYHFLYRDVLFLCCATTVDGDTAALDSAQLAYISQVLAAQRGARWTFVFLHHPLWMYPGNRYWSRLRSALGERHYTAFAGHWHRFVKQGDGAQERYVVSTAGGGYPKEGPPHTRFDHVSWVSVREDRADIAVVRLGCVVHPDSIHASPLRLQQEGTDKSGEERDSAETR